MTTELLPVGGDILFAGTDLRTFLSASNVTKSISEKHPNDAFQGHVVRGMPAMPFFNDRYNMGANFIPTGGTSVDDYAQAIISFLNTNPGAIVVPMPEALQFNRIVRILYNEGYGENIIGLDSGIYLESDKIECYRFLERAGVAVAREWQEVDAKDYDEVLRVVTDYLMKYNGAYMEFPYSAGGKGCRAVRSVDDIREVYETLITEYNEEYTKLFGKKGHWPLKIESQMSGIELSGTILVDRHGNHVSLPLSFDLPARYEIYKGPVSKDNPVTGGLGSGCPHPLSVFCDIGKVFDEKIAAPIVRQMRKEGILRPCILYPGWFAGVAFNGKEVIINKASVSEINIRCGEPDFDSVLSRLRNFGRLLWETVYGDLSRVVPEVRNQLSLVLCYFTGPGGPDGQKGYPWSCTKHEPIELDYNWLDGRNGFRVLPSGASISDDGKLRSDGTRVLYGIKSANIDSKVPLHEQYETLGKRLVTAYDNGRIRVIPREDPDGNRLAIRRDLPYLATHLASLFDYKIAPPDWEKVAKPQV